VDQVENVRKFVPEDEEQKIDLYSYWKIFWRKKFYLIVPLALSLVIAFFGVRELTPVYESSTLVSAEEQNILAGMSRYVTPMEDRRQDQSRRFQAMIETRVMSREFLEMVIRDLDLQNSYKLKTQPNEKSDITGLSEEDLVMRTLVEILRKKISVRTTLPGFYSISVQDSDPETAHVLAYKLSDKYIEVTQQARLQGLRQAGAFSDEQLAIFKEKLEDSERELDRVRRELATRGADTNPINANNLHRAEARVNSLDAQVGRNEMGLNRVRETLSSELSGMIPSTDKITNDETLNNLERQILADTEERILQDLSGNEEAEEDVTAYEALWEELRNRIAEIVHNEYSEFSNDVKPLITEYFFQRRQTSFFRSIERRLNSYIEQYKDNISRRPQLEREASKLAHEVETNQAMYDAFLESKTSAQINEAIQSTNLGVRINVIEKAERPITPVKPNRMKVIVIAAMFGLICGFGAILVTEYMDDSFRTVDEVQKVLKIPVLGTIPKTISHFAWEKKKRGRMIILWTAGMILFILMISGSMFIYAKALQESSIGVELSDDILGR